LGAGDRFDPQSLGIGVGFRFGVVGGWRVGGGGVGGPIALNRGLGFGGSVDRVCGGCPV